MARSVHLGEVEFAEELSVCADGGSAARCHKAISAAVTVVGHGSCYLKHKGESQLSP